MADCVCCRAEESALVEETKVSTACVLCAVCCVLCGVLCAVLCDSEMVVR